MEKSHNIVWVDLEMTGLDISREVIIEMACIVTDKDLNVLGEGINMVIHQPDEILDKMGEWCTKHHGESGLTEAVRQSKISLSECEETMLSYILKYTEKGRCCLAGNSVHADKVFLDKYMPKFMAQLHYRIIDVSTIKELCTRWYPGIYQNAPSKQLCHRAMDDIIESIGELKYYRSNLFVKAAIDDDKGLEHIVFEQS